jgi:ABC-type Fe3+-hydroxamate transport system substrate-binding protein
MASFRVRDDLGRDLVFMRPPERVVSLVPSDTYSLFALGAGARVVGRTAWCVEPVEDVAAIPTVGGTKDIDVDAVVALAPQLVVANQEENTRPALEALAARGVPVLVSLPRRVADGVAHLARLARILGVAQTPGVKELVRKGYAMVSAPPVVAADAPAAFVPIWMDPLMTINAETYGSDALALAGLRNAFGDRERLYPLTADLGKGEAVEATGRDVRYPRITREEVRARAPAVIVLPDEPHAFSAADEAELAALVPAARVVRVSGKDLFWSGAWAVDGVPRLRDALGVVSHDTARRPFA